MDSNGKLKPLTKVTTGPSMIFCPVCGTMLLLENCNHFPQFFCRSCSFRCELEKPMERQITISRKEVDDVLGGDDAWKNVQQTDCTSPSAM
jgi:DNA-directed RNA polymerase III subunit RPC11